MDRFIALLIFSICLVGSFCLGKHMDKIHKQEWQDKKILIEKWIKYSRIKNGSSPFISTTEDLNEAEQDLRKTAAWYNKKYKLYGYCCPPELLFDLED